MCNATEKTLTEKEWRIIHRALLTSEPLGAAGHKRSFQNLNTHQEAQKIVGQIIEALDKAAGKL